MIKEINFIQYKKLKNVTLTFKEGINAISGENGTCKSSLLYLISNSFQAVSAKCEWVKEPAALNIIRAVNAVINPKMESLQRECLLHGDEKYRDPAHGVSGTLYSVSYFGRETLGFRRHNSRSKDKSRFALKPRYPAGSTQSLPFCPVIYLGLSRLVPYGEFSNNDAVLSIKYSLPDSFKAEIAENYRLFTGYEIKYRSLQKLEGIKRRSEFLSDNEGIDSNTISAGEDNLYIILAALESLKFYYQSIESKNEIESVLLIDELDATLHPDYQIRLLELMRTYALKYKIQIVFTTHSLTAIEDILLHHDQFTYLVNNISHVTLMEEPSIEQIKAHLYNKTEEDIYQDKCIPVFTEDEEARDILRLLFTYYENNKPDFRNVRRFFSVPEINIGADILQGLFKDEKLIRSKVGAFCVLDGDHGNDISNCIIALPGKNYNQQGRGVSPEELLFTYISFLYETDDNFWNEPGIIRKGFSKRYYKMHILQEIERYNASAEAGTTSEKRRIFNKKLFRRHLNFFECVFIKWLHDDRNKRLVETFYRNLKVMFKKCAEIRGINPQEWK